MESGSPVSAGLGRKPGGSRQAKRAPWRLGLLRALRRARMGAHPRARAPEGRPPRDFCCSLSLWD